MDIDTSLPAFIRHKDTEEEPIETDALRRLAEKTERQEPVGRRMAAAIIAVPSKGS